MCTNKFSIGGLIGVLVISRVYEAIRTISSQFISLFFFKERFWTYKNSNQAKTNQQKQKQAIKKQGNNFWCPKASKREWFALCCSLYTQNLFVKKINWFKIVLIVSHTLLLMFIIFQTKFIAKKCKRCLKVKDCDKHKECKEHPVKGCQKWGLDLLSWIQKK